jgi:DNA helicase-2/ATP-dependent DNA helicase PcrA
LPGDRYISERRYLRGGLNLEAEALEQLKALADDLFPRYHEGVATEQARVDYAAERLRLLYVGITRARKELIMTWNTGQRGDQVQAIPFAALQGYWEERTRESTP